MRATKDGVVAVYLGSDIIVASWARSPRVANNWGDRLNPHLVQKLSQLPVCHVDDIHNWEDRPVYRVVGSALSGSKSNHVVWGMGFIDSKSGFKEAPLKICAVRGPLSREKFLSGGVNCPEVFGDPALLYSFLYRPTIEKKYDVGIICHYRESGMFDLSCLDKSLKVLFIDICGGIRKVVDEILSCKRIISSSLHGIVCSHAYNVPATWIKLSNLPLGDGFKFNDYFSSIGIDFATPLIINQGQRLSIENDLPISHRSKINLESLVNACPFMTSKRKSEILKTADYVRKNGGMPCVFNI